MAAPTVKISEIGVIKPLKCILGKGSKHQQQGFLQGAYKPDGEIVLYSSTCHSTETDWKSEATLVQQMVITGLNIFGFWYTHASPPNANIVRQCCQEILSDVPEIATKSTQLVVCHIEDSCSSVSNINWFIYDTQSKSAEPCSIDLVTLTVAELEEFVTLHIQARIPLEFCYGQDTDIQTSLSHHFNIIHNKVQSQSTMYRIEKTQILIGQQSEDITCLGPLNKDSPVSSIFKHLDDDEDDDGWGDTGKKTGKKTKKYNEVLDVQLLSRLSEGLGTLEEHKQSCVPVIHYETFNNEWQHASLHLPLSVPVTISMATHLGDLFTLCSEGIQQQLHAMERCLIGHYKKRGLCTPKPYHFQPMSLQHLITVLYPVDVPDKELEDVRRHIHQQFVLPLDRPLLRRANAYRFPADQRGDVYLTNTHIGLAPSGVEGGRPSIVQGTYAYHHYMQDHFDDNKWGCAYRSLQTIFSWFRHQGYMDRSIPTHREIQQALVDVGDKPGKFVGSRQWIGSIEVSTVLNQLIGVTSKILFVSSGADMVTKGRELVMHFQTQGTPIMIGGGVLAHTILGVDWSDKSGDIKFLILDPHYTGGEDLKVIQDKGWCGWKGLEFWDQTAYYNLCLPQRLIEI